MKQYIYWIIFVVTSLAAVPLIATNESSILSCYKIMGLAFAQNVSFSIVSRSRNRNDMRYHLIAAVCSNGIWFLTFRQLVQADMNFVLFIPYTIGTVTGSVWGARTSMVIERWLGAESDSHLKK